MINLVHDRADQWQKLTNEEWDLLVIGGGIVGSGVARDGAMRGLRVALVDQYDFASGTSSRSSRLLHGGLRYLEQGRVGLVREASLEKKIIHRIAPHLARPLGFLFPAYRGDGRPLWQLKIGVKIYDLLCGRGNFEPSRGISREETLADYPDLRSDRLTGSAYYFDALTNDARLVIDTLRSAEKHGAVLLNYTRFADSRRDGNRWICSVRDQETAIEGTIRARGIVNATGPWADRVPHSAVRLRLSKGIHIVIDRKRMTLPSAMVITQGKRILFVIPWGKRIIVGTTDTDFNEVPESVQTDQHDIRYLLQTMNEFFPALKLGSEDIISTWAGIRPLIANPDGSPSDISRAHQIRSPEPGWWDIAGGKLTTYRRMAEQAVDQIVRFLELRTDRCRTHLEPLLESSVDVRYSGVEPDEPSRDAVEHFVRHEWAIHLVDVLVRRSGWCYYHRLSDDTLRLIADWMSAVSNWGDDRRRLELESAKRELRICMPSCSTQGEQAT